MIKKASQHFVCRINLSIFLYTHSLKIIRSNQWPKREKQNEQKLFLSKLQQQHKCLFLQCSVFFYKFKKRKKRKKNEI